MTTATLIAAGIIPTATGPAFNYTAMAPDLRTARAQPGNSVLVWPPKDADETFDYGHDQLLRIADPTDRILETSAVPVVGGVQVVAHYVNPAAPLSTTTWLAGGNEGETARVRVRSRTEQGRRVDQTIEIAINER